MSQVIKNKSELDKHLEPGHPSNDPNYLLWKKQKIKTALKQSDDRSSLIPANKVWENLKIEY